MAAKAKLALFVFIDAFGYEALQREPFLDDILPHKAPLGTIFGYSSTCDPTIITGLMPRDHGHFSFFAYNPARSPFGLCRFLSCLPRSITRRGRVRRMMSRVIKRLYGYTGYFQIYNMPFDRLPLFEYTEKRDLYQPGGINSGARTIFDDLRDRQIPFYLSEWWKPETHNLATLTADLKQGDIEFAYLYLAQMDAILHAFGPESKQGTDKIRWYDRQVRRLLDIAGKHYDTVNLYVFSDHGMTFCGEDCDLIPRIERLGLTFGQHYAAVYDSTMARFWFLNDHAEGAIRAALAEEPLGDILSTETLREWGCDFGNNRYGDLFFLMKPGVLLCPSFMGETHLAGMHGYAPDDRDSVAAFGTNVELPALPQRLDDLFALMQGEIT
jgi:predicted AlkP superfamily pyrophosphatase or phosphodiesterase